MEINNTDNQQSSPIFPSEIMDMVLRRLPPSKLHSCRLISSQWNDLCVRILKESNPNNGNSYHLPISNIKHYVGFVRATNANIFTPFRVSLSSNSTGGVILENLESLKELAGPESIAAVQGLHNLKDSVMFDILKFVSPGLETLVLHQKWFNPNAGFQKIPKSLRRSTASITYPKLKTLICLSPEYGADVAGRKMVQFISTMMPNCPVLQDVELNGDLRSTNRNELTAVMEKIAPTLKGFSYSMERQSNVLPFLFPKFSVLERLKIRVHENKERPRSGFWNTVDLNFTPELTPALKSILIPAGLRLNKIGQGQVTVFPTVTSIVLQVVKPFCKSFHATGDQIKNFLDALFLAFPNVSRLGLDMSGDQEQHESYIKRLIVQLLKSPIAASILELEMRNFSDKVYLCEALLEIETEYLPVAEMKLKGFKVLPKPMDSPDASNATYILKAVDKDKGHYLKNIRTLRLRQDENCGRYTNANRMEFTLIEKEFPSLQVLELSPNMLGSNEGQTAVSENTRKLRSKFTNWAVILLD